MNNNSKIHSTENVYAESTELIYDEKYSNDIEINSYTDVNITNYYSDIFNYYTEEQLKQYVSSPMFYHKQLMRISEKLYNLNGVYGQTVSKMISAPSLDFVIVPSGNNIKKSKKNIQKAHDIFKYKINHKLSSRDCIFNSLIYGEYVAIWRDTKARRVNRPSAYASGKKIEAVGYVDNMMLQPLDLDYVRFEGFSNGDYVVSFDLSYFDMFKGSNLVGEIRNYPREFLLGYNAYRKDSNKRWMLLDQKTTFAYKFHAAENESHGRMLGLQALMDILFAMDYVDSQRANMYDQSASIRYMELPQGERMGSCSLNIDQQRNQYEAFKRAVNASDSNKRNKVGRTTTLKLAPGTKLGKLDMDDTFLKDTLTEENNTSISTDLGLAIGALNATGDASYSALAVNIDLLLSEVFAILEQISFQYTKLINNYLELTDDNKLEFVYLHTSTLNGEEQFNRYKDLYMVGAGSRIYMYSAATGDAQTYMKVMDYEKEMGFDDMYVPHCTSYTFSGNVNEENSDNIGGRPSKNKSELTDSGAKTRTNGGNEMKKLSTK